jgi:hypothetical protein
MDLDIELLSPGHQSKRRSLALMAATVVTVSAFESSSAEAQVVISASVAARDEPSNHFNAPREPLQTVELQLSHVGELVRVASGGLAQGSRYLDHLNVGMQGNLKPLIGIPDTSEPDEVAAIRAELQTLRAAQSEVAVRITRLEERLALITPNPLPAPAPSPPMAPPIGALDDRAESALDISGDLRLRYESNFGASGVRDRDRWVIRGRLRVNVGISDWLTAGAELTTGDPDDPNSTDATFTNFDDDLRISLDQAFLAAQFGPAHVQLGKFVTPFVRTDLVWDSDVHPTGISAQLRTPLSPSLNFGINALYFVIDEDQLGPDSAMLGGQVTLSTTLSNSLTLNFSAGYYDYAIDSVLGANAGDFRSNLIANGSYVSDFNIVDLIASLRWSGFASNWPVQLTVNYAENLGASVPADNGILVDITAGQSQAAGDLRIALGYAEMGVDGTFAAFSNDNIPLATNYRIQTFSVDYTLAPHVIINGTFYRFRVRSSAYPSAITAEDWANRLRMNLLVEF